MSKKQLFKTKLLVFIFILGIYLIFNNFFQSEKIKVCLCSPAKQENLYIREFVEHYKSYSVDKIFLYDNNDIDGENFEDVIDDYIQSKYVEVINFRGQKKVLYEMMNDCYKKNYLNYDWLIYYEIDEYIHLTNYTNIKKFLNENKFKNCETIQLNWCLHTDNNHLLYENKSLKVRFPLSKTSFRSSAIKSILKGKIPNITINCGHKLNGKLKTCDGFGNRTHIIGGGTFNLDYKYYYIDHYSCKSTQEFVDKMNKGDVFYSYDNILNRITTYFVYNNITKEKVQYMKKKLHMNISFEKYLKYK